MKDFTQFFFHLPWFSVMSLSRNHHDFKWYRKACPLTSPANISTLTEKRIFISRSDITYWLPNALECATQIIYPDGISVFADSNYLVPLYQNAMYNYVAAYPECADCRYGGASNVKPSFWP
jgi:hypothetical protein